MGSSARVPFEQASINGMSVRNRLIRSATWMGLCDDGMITEELVDAYRRIARGGVGTVITGFTSVIPNEIPLLGMASLYDDTHIPGHRTLADAVHECGAGIVAQLAISSYCKESGGFVREEDINSLTQNDLDDIVTRFGDAAVRAKAVGYDGVQVHIAHFFFLSRCVSPLINHRSDRYGGNPAGRAGLVREIVAEIRRRTGPDFPLLAKVNGTDAHPGGVTREDLIAICREMESAGLDAVEVSGNNTSRTGIRPGRNEGYFLDYAKLVKENTGLQVISVGGFRSPEAVEDALHCVDFVSMSRPLINDPDLIRRWESGDRTPSRCVSCNTCYTTYGHVCRFCKG